MADASGSRTPPRSRTTTAGSSESHPTPSRISRLFSFGSTSAAASSSRAAEESAVRTSTTGAHEDSSSTSSAASDTDTDIDATLSGLHDGRPSTPTPPARRDAKTASGTLTAPQRRNSKPSFLSSFLQSSSSGPSEPQSNNSKGEDPTTPKRPGVLARPSTDASNATWRLPWTSPKRKPLLFPASSTPHHAHSFESLGHTMNGDAEGTDANALATTESNTSTGDVVDEGISMSDTSGKVGE